MMLGGVLKIITGFIIGRSVGKYCAKNELSPILGIALTVSFVLVACLMIDMGFNNVSQ